MSVKHFLTIVLLSGAAALSAQSINWANDIAPILYQHCAGCHRDGGLGHFSLIGYADAFTNRYEIQNATGERRMPPWMPDPSYRTYAHENRLNDAEIQKISEWVDAGSPSGDLSQAPPDPVFNPESEVGMPDYVLMTPFYTVTATDDEYRCFVIPNGLNQAAYLRGLEAIPGNHEVVHHILIYEDLSGQGKILDAQTPEPGYVSFGGPGMQARLVGAWVPGSRTLLTPANMGVKLTPGADLIVQMHYPKGSFGKSDQTRLNFFFTPSNQGVREITLSPVLNHTPFSLENGPLNIPANEIKTYHAKFTVPQNVSVISVAPHMHLIGRSIESFGITLAGDTIPLIRINDWNFHWQGAYYFQKLQKVPVGTKLHAYAVYDNTVNNPLQPSSPPINVTQGEATTDEMLLVYFAYINYQPGDENVVLDSSLLSSSLPFVPRNAESRPLQVSPNPVQETAELSFELKDPADYRVAVFSEEGRWIEGAEMSFHAAAGLCRHRFDASHLPPGTYWVSVSTNGAEQYWGKMVKLR